MNKQQLQEKIMKKYTANADQKRIPLAGTIEIISNCNFRCVHCYIPDRERVIEKAEFKNYIDQIYELGCRFLTITGGEPLMHPDFCDMYTYAWKKGLAINIYTNGSLIKDSHIDIFKNFPPKHLEITIYGADNDTYNLVTQAKRGFDQVLLGIEKLCANNINLRLKTVMLKENYQDFSKIKEIAEKYSDFFRYDYELMEKTDGDDEPLEHSINEDMVTQFEAHEMTKETLVGMKNKSRKGEKIFSCTAGRSSFVISSDSNVRICNFGTVTNMSLKEYSFKQIWDKYGEIVEQKFSLDDQCYNCEYKDFCTNCPVKTYLKTGGLTVKPITEYCTKAKQLYEKYNAFLENDK